MKRNTVTIIKYFVSVILFVVFGPLIVRSLIGKRSNSLSLPVVRDSANFPNAPNDGMETARNLQILATTRRYGRQSSFGALKGGKPFWPEDVDSDGKVDWHDFQRIEEEKKRVGPGEQGTAVIVGAEETESRDELYKVNGFNALASDKISLDRALNDIRHPDCKNKRYLRNLPNVSVVVPFHNEHWSTLLRTAHSVINRSPAHLMHEVILVDDFSNKEFLKEKLDKHVASNYAGKVKVVHAAKREGLIRTRLLGAKAATGEVLIFLDSHVEANVNWLPPLLEPIAKDYRTVVCPFIDVIDYENFVYRAQDEGARGAFDWEFFYKRLPRLKEDAKHPADPFASPVMAGGLFAISSKWFWELGGYDTGLEIWGGEQYELSFKLWQCGGMMVDAPCSRVGHIYRKFAPFPNPGLGDFVGKNYRRVAEVWMDEYADFLYRRRPHYRQIDPGDLSEQRAVRRRLRCKPFRWFMAEVAFDLERTYPAVEPTNHAEGELRNVATQLCVDTKFKVTNDRFGLDVCIKDRKDQDGEQQMALTWHRDIRPGKRTVCFDVSQSIAKAPVILFSCHGQRGNQLFKYHPDRLQLFHPISNQCLDADGAQRELFMTPCDDRSATQRWAFEKFNRTALVVDWDKTNDEP